jgi:hypothetical protein
MLWKPYSPIYPKLVKNVAEGLTFEETKEMRNRGLTSPPLMKLSKWTSWLKTKYELLLFFLFAIMIEKLVVKCMEAWFYWSQFLLDDIFAAARNGVYVNVVERVREAFKTEEVVRLDCTHVGTSDCKRIGVKLRVILLIRE